MLSLKFEGDRILVAGRFDHPQVTTAEEFFAGLDDSKVVDFKELEYISSAGIGVLLRTQKRLQLSGRALRIVNPNLHVRAVFQLAGLTEIFRME